MQRLFLTAVLAAFSLAASANAAPHNSPEGRWLSGSGNVVVQIAPCGPVLCGTIVKVLANNAMDGGAPMAPGPGGGVGLKIMTDFKPGGPSRWVGRLYNRQTGKTYDCQLSGIGPAQMTVRPYVLLPLIGKTQVWRREP